MHQVLFTRNEYSFVTGSFAQVLLIISKMGGMIWLRARYRYPWKRVRVSGILSADSFKANTVLRRKRV
jgi:hypothetical protein